MNTSKKKLSFAKMTAGFEAKTRHMQTLQACKHYHTFGTNGKCVNCGMPLLSYKNKPFCMWEECLG